MLIVALAWIYVVLMMAVAEALSSQGTVLGAAFTLLLYGVLPLVIVLYIGGTPGRRRMRKAREAQEAAASASGDVPSAAVASAPPDRGGHAPGAAVAAERKEE